MVSQEGQSYDEIAAALDGSVESARVATHRLRKVLRERVPEVNEALHALAS